VRERVCTDMNWCGLTLDVERNVSTASVEEKASVPDSRIEADVIPVDEGVAISRDAARCVHASERTKVGFEAGQRKGGSDCRNLRSL
jgi:acetate kinase